MAGLNLFTNALSPISGIGKAIGNVGGAIGRGIGGLFGGGSSTTPTGGSGQGGFTLPDSLNPYKVNERVSNTIANNRELELLAQISRERDRRYNTVAPALDIASLNAQARKRATAATNPYYQKKLNEFLKKNKTRKVRAREDFSTQDKELDRILKETLELSDTTRERTTEDVARNIDELNAQEDFSQTTEGTEFDRALRSLRGQTAEANLTTSGLGQQAEAEGISDRNVQSAEEARQFNVQKETQRIFKTRKLGDLDKADTKATELSKIDKKVLKRNLNRTIEDIETDITEGRSLIEEQRVRAVADEEAKRRKIAFNKYISGISDPYAIEAAQRQYGGLF